MSDHINTSSTSSAGSAMPDTEYDVMLTDVQEETLDMIGQDNHQPHLGTGRFSEQPFLVEGVIYGLNRRLVVCWNCSFAKKKNAPVYMVWFLVDTGSPHTYISEKTFTKAVSDDGSTWSQVPLLIQDPSRIITCSKSQGHFRDVHVLGMNLMAAFELSPIISSNGDMTRLHLSKTNTCTHWLIYGSPAGRKLNVSRQSF